MFLCGNHKHLNSVALLWQCSSPKKRWGGGVGGELSYSGKAIQLTRKASDEVRSFIFRKMSKNLRIIWNTDSRLIHTSNPDLLHANPNLMHISLCFTFLSHLTKFLSMFFFSLGVVWVFSPLLLASIQLLSNRQAVITLRCTCACTHACIRIP